MPPSARASKLVHVLVMASSMTILMQTASSEEPKELPMDQRVTGIGGVFIKAQDPKALREWYSKHLGIHTENAGGTVFRWGTPDQPNVDGKTAWSIFPATTKYFSPGHASFMVDYRVKDLRALLAALRSEGCEVDDKVDESVYGKFGWVVDPEGNRIELWEPPAAAAKAP
jgi:predicted enzyme related to lactoylglutathione lyase